jgi:hypothetical protein
MRGLLCGASPDVASYGYSLHILMLSSQRLQHYLPSNLQLAHFLVAINIACLRQSSSCKQSPYPDRARGSCLLSSSAGGRLNVRPRTALISSSHIVRECPICIACSLRACCGSGAARRRIFPAPPGWAFRPCCLIECSICGFILPNICLKRVRRVNPGTAQSIILPPRILSSPRRGRDEGLAMAACVMSLATCGVLDTARPGPGRRCGHFRSFEAGRVDEAYSGGNNVPSHSLRNLSACDSRYKRREA